MRAINKITSGMLMSCLLVVYWTVFTIVIKSICWPLDSTQHHYLATNVLSVPTIELNLILRSQ